LDGRTGLDVLGGGCGKRGGVVLVRIEGSGDGGEGVRNGEVGGEGVCAKGCWAVRST
jgi:hypothetical protein